MILFYFIIVKKLVPHVIFPKAPHRREAFCLSYMWKEILQEGESSGTQGQKLCNTAASEEKNKTKPF